MTQAGINKITLYENKGFHFLYDVSEEINTSSITNTGEVIDLLADNEKPRFLNNLEPAGNNFVLNNYTINFEVNGLSEDNFTTLQQIQSSIYGWIPVIEFLDNTIYLINAPFFEKVDTFDSNVTHTFFIELKPRVFTTQELQKCKVEASTAVNGLLAFDGVDDGISYTSPYILPSSGFIEFKTYLYNTSGYNTGSNQETIIVFGIELPNNRNGLVRLYDDKIIFIMPDGVGGWNRYYYSIVGLGLAQLKFRFTWNSWLYSELTINDIVTVPTLAFLGGQLSGDNIRIGYIPGAGFVSDCLIWDVNINDAHAYAGQPDGNLSPAWADSIGINDGVVLGSPTTVNI